jgi:acetyltransferase
MSGYNLKSLLAPRSVAVIGASDRPGSVGCVVMRNLMSGGFAGNLWPVNLRRATVAGRQAYPAAHNLPAAPDLAVICTPAASIPGIIEELGARGTRAAVIISAGLEAPSSERGSLSDAMRLAARRHGVRILGPNCIGVIVPRVGLNASFAHVNAHPGEIAFVAQSGALTTAMLDWAASAGVGFSHCISLGNAADVDFGDLLDYLGKDPHTRAILLYIESITGARKFMSAARAAARNKPVIAVKAGRTTAAARVATSHSGALAGTDAVYEAALRRAGVLRVKSVRQLFEAAQVLAQCRSYRGGRLAIVSNGGGPAVMATDALIEGDGELATLTPQTLAALDALLPAGWSHTNPVDIVGDAAPQRYADCLATVLKDPGVDAVLVLHAPTAMAAADEVATACGALFARSDRPILRCWLGSPGPPGSSTASGYATPEEAVEAFQHLVRYHHGQRLLLETPSSLPEGRPPDTNVARSIVAAALACGRATLTEVESKHLLSAYDIPVVDTRVARAASELPSLAAAIGYPVALKILSPDISHKSDVGGVALNLTSAQELQVAAQAMLRRCQERKPQARIEGFTVQEMIRRGGAHELLAGIATDQTFGPVVLFGRGGTDVEVIGDRALGLPPLTAGLAREMIMRTQVSRLLPASRGRPSANQEAIETTLVKVGRLASDIAEISELDINPLLADEHGVIALDARVRITATRGEPSARLAIRPYPAELEERARLGERNVLLRPIRPEDLALYRSFLAQISPQDLYTRFFTHLRELPDVDVAHFTQIDYDREMAFLALGRSTTGEEEILGVARACADPDNTAAEFAVLVRSDSKNQGLGGLLMRKLIGYCRARGIRRLWGSTLSENLAMQHLAASLGFRTCRVDHNVLEIELQLQERAGEHASSTSPAA